MVVNLYYLIYEKNMNIKELAKKLNLSITTVSRGLADYSDVSEKTKKRIKKFAEKYNYNPNPYAANLASRSSKNLGFILPLLSAFLNFFDNVPL